MEEALRLVDAHQFVDTYGEVCPANWQKGQEGMKATKDGYRDFIAGEKKPGDVIMEGQPNLGITHVKRAMENGH